jgi:DNA-binding LacI/PurR family transcriptional regulator
MKELDYSPRVRRSGPRISASPRKKKTDPIVCVLYGRGRDLLNFSYVAKIVGGMTSGAQDMKVPLMIMEMPDRRVLPDMLRQGRFSGCVLMGNDLPADAADVFHPYPVVWVGAGNDAVRKFDCVHPDYREEAVIACNYLLQLGCRNLAFVNHLPSHSGFSLMREVFADMSAGNGCKLSVFEPDDSNVSEGPGWDMTYLHNTQNELLKKILSEQSLPDGIFLPTDQQAAVMHSLLREHGIEPEKDLHLVSCNNDHPWRMTMNPCPATIDNRPDQMGRAAVRQLMNRIQHPNEPLMRISVQPRLVI